MAWNKPNDHKSKLDPWGRKHSNEKDDIVKTDDTTNTVQNNNAVDMKTFLGKMKNNKISKKNSANASKRTKHPLFIILCIIFFIWFTHGFYTINENEKGVVTILGKFDQLAEPGLNWRPVFLKNVNIVNISHVYISNTSSTILTLDNNRVRVLTNIKYKIMNPADYLFSASHPVNTFQKVIASAVNNVVGTMNINQLVLEQQEAVKNKIKNKIEEIVKLYKMGMMILDINMQIIELPHRSQSVCKDIIVSDTDSNKLMNRSEKYWNTIASNAYRQSEHILELSRLYASHIVLEKREATYLSQLLSEYQTAKLIALKHLYIQSINRFFISHRIVVFDQKICHFFSIF